MTTIADLRGARTGFNDVADVLEGFDLDSGLYTPTLANLENLDASVASECMYLRIGDIVHVAGNFTADATSNSALTRLRMSLPIASTISSPIEAGGTMHSAGSTAEVGGAVKGQVSNNNAEFFWDSGSTSNVSYYFTFTYRVI